MLKLMILPRRKLGITRAQMHAHALGPHASLVLGHIEEAPQFAPQRYVQNHVFDATRAAPPSLLASAPDMLTQVWFNSPEQAKAAMTHPFHRETLAPDEDRFVDQSTVQRVPARERLLSGSADGAFKAFVLLPRAPSAPPERFAKGLARLHELLPGLAAAGSVRGHAHNTAMPRPGDSVVADAVEEFWLPSEADARTVGSEVLALAEARGTAEDWLAPYSAVLLLAREHVMYVGRPNGA